MVLHDADDVFYAAAVVCYDVVVRFFSSPIASSILAARHDRVPGADVCAIGENEFAPVELGVRAPCQYSAHVAWSDGLDMYTGKVSRQPTAQNGKCTTWLHALCLSAQ